MEVGDDTEPTQELKPYICGACYKLYENDDQLIEHLKTHEDDNSEQHDGARPEKAPLGGENPGRCVENEVCDNQHTHLQVDDNVLPFDCMEEKPQRCDECGKIFTEKEAFDEHVLKHNNGKQQETGQSEEVTENPEVHNDTLVGDLVIKSNACKLCGALFVNKKAVASHMRVHKNNGVYCEDVKKHKRMRAGADKSTDEETVPKKVVVIRPDRLVLCSAELSCDVHTEEEPPTCDVCAKIFVNQEFLANHKKTHRSDVLHTCNVCRMVFKIENAWAKHKKSIHDDRKKSAHFCAICNMRFSNDSDLRIHARIAHLSCLYCDEIFNTHSAYTRHIMTHRGLDPTVSNNTTDTGDKPHTCQRCGKSFRTAYNLKLNSKVHAEGKLFVCEECGKCFVNAGALALHSVLHKRNQGTDGNMYQCTECGKTFRNMFTLNAHLRTHNVPYRCEACQKTFIIKESLEEHMRTHTAEKPHHCEHCDMTFTQEVHLQRHHRSHAAERPYQCKLCYKQLTTRCNACPKVEIYEGVKRYQCDVCDEAFSEITELELHQQSHPKEGTNMCNICTAVFPRKELLENHQRDGQPSHTCNICKTVFVKKEVLETHKCEGNGTAVLNYCQSLKQRGKDNKTDESENPSEDGVPKRRKWGTDKHKDVGMITEKDSGGRVIYKCAYCGKFLKVKVSMQGHIRLHTGERPHQCPLCDEAYTNKNSLKNHVVAQHCGRGWKR